MRPLSGRLSRLVPAAQVGPQAAEVGILGPAARRLAYRAALGSRLIAGYALGSLAHYIDDHIARLRAVGHHRLADRFHRWRTRLLA